MTTFFLIVYFNLLLALTIFWDRTKFFIRLENFDSAGNVYMTIFAANGDNFVNTGCFCRLLYDILCVLWATCWFHVRTQLALNCAWWWKYLRAKNTSVDILPLLPLTLRRCEKVHDDVSCTKESLYPCLNKLWLRVFCASSTVIHAKEKFLVSSSAIACHTRRDTEAVSYMGAVGFFDKKSVGRMTSRTFQP